MKRKDGTQCSSQAKFNKHLSRVEANVHSASIEMVSRPLCRLSVNCTRSNIQLTHTGETGKRSSVEEAERFSDATTARSGTAIVRTIE